MSVTCDRSVVSSTMTINRHDITKILLKVALNIIASQTRLMYEETPYLHSYSTVNFIYVDNIWELFLVNLVSVLQDTKGLPVYLTWGACVPDSCQTSDIAGMFHMGKNNFIIIRRSSMFLLFILYNRLMVFNTTFNNFSVISWWTDLLVKETTVASHWQTLYQNTVLRSPCHERDSNRYIVQYHQSRHQCFGHQYT